MIHRPTLIASILLLAAVTAVSGRADQAAAPTEVANAPTSTAAAPATDAAAASAPAGEGQVAVSSATAAEAKKVTCRTERVTGSNFRTRKVCTTPNSQDASGNWVRDQQDRGAIGASAILNSAGGG